MTNGDILKNLSYSNKRNFQIIYLANGTKDCVCKKKKEKEIEDEYVIISLILQQIWLLCNVCIYNYT